MLAGKPWWYLENLSWDLPWWYPGGPFPGFMPGAGQGTSVCALWGQGLKRQLGPMSALSWFCPGPVLDEVATRLSVSCFLFHLRKKINKKKAPFLPPLPLKREHVGLRHGSGLSSVKQCDYFHGGWVCLLAFSLSAMRSWGVTWRSCQPFPPKLWRSTPPWPTGKTPESS